MPAANTDLFPQYQALDQAPMAAQAFADPTAPMKTWFDPNPPGVDPEGNITYHRVPTEAELGAGADPTQLVPFKVRAAAAAFVNLPGIVKKVPYVTLPSRGLIVISGPAGSGTEPIPDHMVSTLAQAEYFAQLFSTPALPWSVVEWATENSTPGGNPLLFEVGSTARLYFVQAGPNGPQYNVGQLLGTQYALGLNFGGTWDASDLVKGPQFTPHAVSLIPGPGKVPVPAQPIPAGHKVVYTTVFGFTFCQYAAN